MYVANLGFSFAPPQMSPHAYEGKYTRESTVCPLRGKEAFRCEFQRELATSVRGRSVWSDQSRAMDGQSAVHGLPRGLRVAMDLPGGVQRPAGLT